MSTRVKISPAAWRDWLWHHRARVAVLFVGVLAPLVVFGAIAEDIWDKESLRYDDPLLLWAHSWATPQLDRVMLAFTHIGSPPLMVTMCGVVALYLWKRTRRGDLAFFLAATIGAGLLNYAAKHLFGRERPDLWLSIDPRSDLSFPSGHAMGTMALFAALCVLAWPTRWRGPVLLGSIFMVFAVGLSRIYIGVHFPSDVLCGWLASLSWVVGLHLIRRSRRYNGDKQVVS